jgi:hypothetical protein
MEMVSRVLASKFVATYALYGANCFSFHSGCGAGELAQTSENMKGYTNPYTGRPRNAHFGSPPKFLEHSAKQMNPESLQRTSHVLFWLTIGLPIFAAAFCLTALGILPSGFADTS